MARDHDASRRSDTPEGTAPAETVVKPQRLEEVRERREGSQIAGLVEPTCPTDGNSRRTGRSAVPGDRVGNPQQLPGDRDQGDLGRLALRLEPLAEVPKQAGYPSDGQRPMYSARRTSLRPPRTVTPTSPRTLGESSK
jgi:hypothetical protein